MVIESIAVTEPKTKAKVAVLKNLGLEGKSVLVVIPGKDENIFFASRNIPCVNVARVADLNPYQILIHDRILMTKDAVSTMAEAGRR